MAPPSGAASDGPGSLARAVACAVVLAILVTGVATGDVGAPAGSTQSTVADSSSVAVDAVDGGFTDVIRTDEGYLLVGWVETSDGTQRGWVVKTDANGAVEWERTLGDADFARLLSAARGPNGSYVVAGTRSAGTHTDGWVVALAPDGTTKWERLVNGARSDGFREVVAAPDGGYLLAGVAVGEGGSDGWAVRVDERGETVWRRTYDGGASDAAFYTALRRDGGYLLAGRAGGHGWATAVDGSGDVAWSRSLDDGTTLVYHAAPAGDGYLLAGAGVGTNGTTDGRALELAANGTTRWARSVGGPHTDRFLTAVRANDGGAILVGVTQASSDGTGLGWAVKLENGSVAWDVVYGDDQRWDAIWSVAPAHDGGYVLAAKAASFGVSLEAQQIHVRGGATAEIDDAAPDEPGVTVALDASPVTAVELPDDATRGVVSVGRRQRVPTAGTPPGRLVYALDVAVPYSLRNASAALTLTVNASDVPTERFDPSRLAVFQATDDGWRRVNATVLDVGRSNATLRAPVEGFSTVAVTVLVPPRATVDAPATVTAGEPVTLRATAAPTNGSLVPTAYRWTVGNETLHGRNVTVSFDEPGDRSVRLRVRDRFNLTRETTATVLVNDRPRVAVERPGAATVGEEIRLRANVTNAVGDATVTWTVDGETYTGRTVEVAFDSPGSRTVRVRVSDEYGATTERDVTVAISPAPSATESATSSPTSAGGPGFDLDAIVLVFATAILLALRRR